MKFLVDNALSFVVADRLTNLGFDAVHVRERALQAANRQSRKPSFILFRGDATRSAERQVALLAANLQVLEISLRSGCVVVFGERRMRLRLLPIGREA